MRERRKWEWRWEWRWGVRRFMYAGGRGKTKYAPLQYFPSSIYPVTPYNMKAKLGGR
jgi:hypothetical protein